VFRELHRLRVCLVSFGQGIQNRLHGLLHHFVPVFVLVVAVTSLQSFPLELLGREAVALLDAYPPQLVQCLPISIAQLADCPCPACVVSATEEPFGLPSLCTVPLLFHRGL
jgi:hypothetical protein